MPSDAAREPHWVPLDAIIELNARLTAQTGEPHRLLSPSLLESAWARPLNLWAYQDETDLVRLAVALMAGVAQNHPFQQGNKRTAFESGAGLLIANGWLLDPQLDDPELADAFVALIGHTLTEREFAERLRPHVRPR